MDVSAELHGACRHGFHGKVARKCSVRWPELVTLQQFEVKVSTNVKVFTICFKTLAVNTIFFFFYKIPKFYIPNLHKINSPQPSATPVLHISCPEVSKCGARSGAHTEIIEPTNVQNWWISPQASPLCDIFPKASSSSSETHPSDMHISSKPN